MMWLVYISLFLFIYFLWFDDPGKFHSLQYVEVVRFLCVLKRETDTTVIGSGKLKRPAFRVMMYGSSYV